MTTRALGPFTVSSIGLGCMSLSHAYGTPPDAAYGARLLNRALDIGHTFLDTAAVYGLGANETLIGETLKGRRGEFTLASKCGIWRTPDGKREINGSPQAIRAVCEESLKRLQTDVIDLYYLHRVDKKTPIEDSVGALADLVREGKIRTIGLSECSAATLRRAHKVHPVTAVQSEYSLWTRNPEVAVLDACRELGVTFVAFSPVARGFLADGVRDMAALPPGDLRQQMPRFMGEAFAVNLALLDKFRSFARDKGATPAQVCLAWLLQKVPHIVPIPGTANIAHMEENFAARELVLSDGDIAALNDMINTRTVTGHRYSAAQQADIDTEEVAA